MIPPAGNFQTISLLYSLSTGMIVSSAVIHEQIIRSEDNPLTNIFEAIKNSYMLSNILKKRNDDVMKNFNIQSSQG
jgi:hypothetical protein